MNRLNQAVAILAIAFIGCDGKGEMGPGMFTHVAIQRTIAPWDGPALRFLFAERPLSREKLATSRIDVTIYSMVDQSGKSRFRIEGIDRRKGSCVWIDADGKSTPLTWAEIEIEKFTSDAPVEGWYDLNFDDGRRERGRFRADWWPGEGRGG